jgi:hypothetical protein
MYWQRAEFAHATAAAKNRTRVRMKAANRTAQLAARKADRERDALHAMRDYQAEQARIDANTARLRALRLAKEAAGAAVEQTVVAPKPARGVAKAVRGTPVGSSA